MGIREYCGQILCDRRWPDGKRFKRAYPNRKQAENMLTRIQASILDGSWRRFRDELQLRNRDKVRLKSFIETYMEDYARPRNKKSSVVRKRVAFNAIEPLLGKLELEEITPARLHNYVRLRKKTGVSDATVNREIAVLKHALGYAVEIGLLKENPVERFKLLREERTERPRFSDEQIAAVIAALRPDCRPLFVFIRETGCRRGEALSLTHEQVQMESQLVVFNHDTKSRRYRYVPLTDAALEAVNALPKLGGCPYVFYNPKTQDRWRQCRIEWQKARDKAGVPNLQVKDLRRYYAISLAERGASMHDIQQVLGHASVATTERHYAQFSPEHSARKILRVLQGGKSDGTKAGLSRQEPDEEPNSGENTRCLSG